MQWEPAIDPLTLGFGLKTDAGVPREVPRAPGANEA